MNPRNVEDVIKDFKDRRAGIMRALTKDVEDLYKLCDPSNPNLCLYGYPNQQWEVNLPPPSDLPEPRLGINFARDTMSKQEWLSMVALHSDAWLYAVASYFASKLYFDKADKKRLFNKISDVPSLLEAVGRGNARIRKRAKMEGGGIPEHILDEEVLSRVPVRDLLKYRSVCKMWLCLIDGPNFVSAHLKNFKTNSEATHLLVMYRARGWADEQILVRRADTFRKVHQLKNTYASHHVVSYVNGVILVKVGNYRSFPQIVLWNPSIDKSVDVPADSMIFGAMEDATYFELGFGYDASYNDYKVVAIVYPHAEIRYTYGVRYRATVPGLLQVYTLTKNFWTSNIAVSPPPYWTVGPQVYLNGAIHWINFGPNVADDSWYKTKDSYVVLFDIEIEVFKYFELPTRMKTDDEPRENFPTVLGRSFAIFCSYNEARHDIWLMTEYGVANSWTKVYTFTLHLDKLLHFNVNGELLFAVQGKGIKSYDVNNKRVKDLAKTYSKSSNYTVFTYVESLLLFKQGQITQSQSQ